MIEIAVTGLARRLRLAALSAALFVPLVALAPGAAEASTATIKRSVQNLLLFPVDLAMSPYVATKAVYTSWRGSDDTDAVKIAYAVPSVPWAISVNAGASMLRGVAGALELLPGLVLIPFEADMRPLFDLAENNNAVFDSGDEGIARVRLGIDYISPSDY
mgnify:CR=1 FL=1